MVLAFIVLGIVAVVFGVGGIIYAFSDEGLNNGAFNAFKYALVGLAALILMVVVGIVGSVQQYNDNVDRCHAANGTVVNQYRGLLCVSDDGRIITKY